MVPTVLPFVERCLEIPRHFNLGRRGFFEDMFRGFDQMKQERKRV